ncbi:unnamed protein product [Orchesella dallaii]|uniref:Gametogenetin-binding protein 2 n=1 Tax=Orchesella dallaii TaxID=48710 RepID=A0ABP1R471_9HEXA
MARLTDVFKEGETAYKGLKHRRVPIFIDDNISFVMDMDPEYLTGDDAVGPTKTEMDQFQKKFKMLTKAELEAALRVTPEDFVSILNQMVPCVGCRRSAESVFQQYQDGPSYGFYPLCMDEKGIMYLAKDKMTPKFLCSMFHCPSSKVQNLVDSLSKCKSGRRCALHSLESQRIRTVSSWVDVWDYMDEKCQQRTVMVDSKCLIETLERYLKKHRFCTECKSKVLRAYNILTGELDPSSEPGFIAQLYEGIECCKEDQHLHLLCKTEFVSRLIAKAVPELVGSSRRERHAKTMEIAQEEVLTCLGLCVFERLHRIQQRFREEERTWEIIMCTAIQALRRSFEVAVENKLGVSQLELLCQELNKEELAKQQRKERKKLNRKRKKGKKSEESTESLPDDADEKENETVEVENESFIDAADEEEEVEEAQDEEDSCQCEIVETAPSKGRKKKKSGKGKGKKANVSSELPLRQVANEVDEKFEPNVQKGSAVSLCQESRCASETSRDGGYSSESTSVNHDHTTCSSLEGSEIACADDCCRLSAGFSLDFMNSDNEPSPPQKPYRSLMEQLEEAGASDAEEDSNWVPPEISAIKTESWGQEREQLRETLKQRFNEMLSKRKTGCFRRLGCTDNQHATDRDCTDYFERDENRAPDPVDPGNPPKETTNLSKKQNRSSNKGHRAGGQNNRNYKGKNRR